MHVSELVTVSVLIKKYTIHTPKKCSSLYTIPHSGIVTYQVYVIVHTSIVNLGTGGTRYLVCALEPSPQSQAGHIVPDKLRARKLTHRYDVVRDPWPFVGRQKLCVRSDMNLIMRLVMTKTKYQQCGSTLEHSSDSIHYGLLSYSNSAWCLRRTHCRPPTTLFLTRF